MYTCAMCTYRVAHSMHFDDVVVVAKLCCVCVPFHFTMLNLSNAKSPSVFVTRTNTVLYEFQLNTENKMRTKIESA